MGLYLVEFSLPNPTIDQFLRQFRVPSPGSEVHCIWAIHVPEDGCSFSLFDAPSIEVVGGVFDGGGVQYDRVIEAVEPLEQRSIPILGGIEDTSAGEMTGASWCGG